jgi:hypothetical protein
MLPILSGIVDFIAYSWVVMSVLSPKPSSRSSGSICCSTEAVSCAQLAQPSQIELPRRLLEVIVEHSRPDDHGSRAAGEAGREEISRMDGVWLPLWDIRCNRRETVTVDRALAARCQSEQLNVIIDSVNRHFGKLGINFGNARLVDAAKFIVARNVEAMFFGFPLKSMTSAQYFDIAFKSPHASSRSNLQHRIYHPLLDADICEKLRHAEQIIDL